jgi:Tfp pilus assembly protein PilV
MRKRQGLSIIEVLIAAVLMLAVALGVVPLFVRSISANSTGQEYTQVSNYARAHAEELFQLPFSSPELVIPGGQTEVVTSEYFSSVTDRWEPAATPPDPTEPARWRRTTTIRQYSVNALVEDTTDPSTPVFKLVTANALDGNADPQNVQLKEIQVTIDSTRKTGPLGTKGQLTVWLLKSQ